MISRNDTLEAGRRATRLLLGAAVIAVWTLTPATASAQTPFPQQITAPEGSVIVYQPQPETLEGNVLTGRAAMSLELQAREEPVFGVFWFTAIVEDDDESGLTYLREIRVSQVRWPESTAAGEARFTEVVEEAASGAVLSLPTKELSSSLVSAQIEQRSLEQLKHDPPVILFRDQVSVLLLYDGDPRWSDVDNSSYERAINTPYLVVRDKRTAASYLSSGSLWYAATDPLGPWQPITDPPSDLVAMLPPPDEDSPVPATPPQIVTATEPTELISSDGQPRWTPIGDGDLLYVPNTGTPWLREVASNQMYVLISGRWFRAGGESGPWEFVRGDQLPDSFQQIPADSDLGGARVSVAGTDEAEDAVLDAAVPKTAAIRRDEATLTVEYDGDPEFEAIPGTDVSMAVNTPTQVLEIDSQYYAVDNGVWFQAASSTGPWQVADSVPREQIDEIPMSSPAHNVTYVRIYQSTPQIVYVGYTPGYLWSFPYYGVPVYGSGWYYPPYRWWYPRPYTYGLHVGYNPWTGWNFGVSWNVGFMHFGMSWGGGYRGPWRGYYGGGSCCGGWYGGYRPGWGGGFHGGGNTINIGSINIGNNINFGNQGRIANSLQGRPRADQLRTPSVYNRPEVASRNADRSAVQRDAQRARAVQRPNNVLSDRNGNVVRDTQNGLQTRSGNGWQNIDRSAARGAVQNRAGSIDRSAIQRDMQARQRGAQRVQRQRQVPRRSGGRRGRLEPFPAPVVGIRAPGLELLAQWTESKAGLELFLPRAESK